MSERPVKISLVSSHGGHLTELLELAEAFAGYETFHVTYDADTTRRLANVYLLPNRPYSPVAFVRNLWRFWRIYRKESPNFIVSTGAEIAIPAFIVAKLMQIPALYIECGCQVTRPSLTGRIVARLTHHFWVQWPELLDAYRGRAQYMGSLIDEARS